MNTTGTIVIPRTRSPSREEMDAVFSMCRQNQWTSVMNCIRSNARIAITSMIMDNHISTTILHQAITSKGDTKARTRVIREIIDIAPKAANIKNGYGSLPLHVIAQRNTKMNAPTKELLIMELVNANKGALVEHGGVGKRTPLHIIFTDYISPRITEMMIENGRKACFMKDKKGYLPVHVACSRHCSPEKLQMLLNVNPESLSARTNDGHTLLSLAITTATKSHPNYALIEDIRRRCIEANLVDISTVIPTTKISTTTRTTRSPTPRQNKKKTTGVRKRKVTVETEVVPETDPTLEEDPATLLLHFSRHQDKKIKLVAKV